MSLMDQIGSVLEGVNGIYSSATSVYESATGQAKTQPATTVTTTQQPATTAVTNENKTFGIDNKTLMYIGGGVAVLAILYAITR